MVSEMTCTVHAMPPLNELPEPVMENITTPSIPRRKYGVDNTFMFTMTRFRSLILLIGVFCFLCPSPSYSQTPLLPQAHPYQVTLYNWLKTIDVSDVEVPHGASITWDGTYANQQQMANLYNEVRPDGDSRRGWNISTMSEAKWYVLDDGQGHGIEGYARAEGNDRVRLPRISDRTGGIFGMASQLAWWYDWDVPLAGNGQGNPLYKHEGAGTRALVIAAVDMMMLQHCIDSRPPGEKSVVGCGDGWGDRTDFIGGYVIATAEAVLLAGELLDAPVREAFFDGLDQLVERMLELGARDVNSNMDGKAVEGCALASEALKEFGSNHRLGDRCVELSRLVLFGYRDGQIDQKPYKIDSDKGIFYLEGLVREADGPETTYNGRSMAHLASARVRTYGDSDWDFLDGVLTRMCDFMYIQFYHQPYADPQFQSPQVPTAYSNRTAEGVLSPQDTPWQNLALGYLYESCRPALWAWKHNKDYVVRPPNELKWQAERAFGDISEIPLFTEVPQQWRVKEPWPMITPFMPPSSDWYATLRGYIDRGEYLYPNHPQVDQQYNRMFPDASEALDTWQNREQWWARRAGAPGSEFSYLLEGTVFSGTYGGYYSGKVEAFWREGQGPVLLSLRTRSGQDDLSAWRIDHVWGYDEQGSPFSWGR